MFNTYNNFPAFLNPADIKTNAEHESAADKKGMPHADQHRYTEYKTGPSLNEKAGAKTWVNKPLKWHL